MLDLGMVVLFLDNLEVLVVEVLITVVAAVQALLDKVIMAVLVDLQLGHLQLGVVVDQVL